MTGALTFAVRLAGFVATILLWRSVARGNFHAPVSVGLILGALALVIPVTWVGRTAIDRDRAASRLEWITWGVHFVLMILFGVSIVEAVKVLSSIRGVTIPLPAPIGAACLAVSGACLALTVVNLAVSGLGAPFAIALSTRVAQRWMYRWTRNPMVLCTLATLASAGLYFRSLLLVAWTVACAGPAWVFFLKVYEERELEMRFGEKYLDYKARTSFLWPRRQVPERAPLPGGLPR